MWWWFILLVIVGGSKHGGYAMEISEDVAPPGVVPEEIISKEDAGIFATSGNCKGSSHACIEYHWTEWSECSMSCGGGLQERNYGKWCMCSSHPPLYCEEDDDTEIRTCEEWCEPGGEIEDGFCHCQDEFFGYCCEKDCPTVKWCDKYYCNDPQTVCTQCDHFAGSTYDTSAYWLSDDKWPNECIPRCNWVGHWCFPGTCDKGDEYFASTCNCDQGFELDTPDDETTKCKLIHEPLIETCRLGFEDPSGNAFNSSFVGSTTSCDNTRDTFVNAQPKELFIAYDFSFRLPTNQTDGDDRHTYIDSFSFGIVGAEVDLIWYKKSGEIKQLENHKLPSAPTASCSATDFNPLNPESAPISCEMTNEYEHDEISDGDMLCQHFLAIGSGYVRIKDIVDNSVSKEHHYDKTTINAEKCFRADFVKPNHCANDGTCQYDPLGIGPRIQRDSFVQATFDGYYDPDPGSAAGPSDLNGFIMQVYTMQNNKHSLSVSLNYEEEYNISVGSVDFQFNLPELGTPMMFCIYLQTVDLARNVRFARRFVLFDNVSILEVDSHNPILPISANPSTGHKWQVNLNPVIVDWYEHFYNDYFRHTNWLLKIDPDQHIEGIFEQTDEPLPVAGTPNVHGIVTFLYKYEKTSPTANKSTSYRTIDIVTDQQVTLTDLSVTDGDAIEVSVKAIDINNNTITDSFQVFIDSSPPLLRNLWLEKYGYKQLFVHNSRDLSKMSFTFESLDPDSSLKQVRWKLGTSHQTEDIGKGSLPVVKHNTSCLESISCYCPIIGQCSDFKYTIPLNNLIDGDHNRQYFLWVEVFNEANLRTVEEITILVDTSPPEPGVVLDGPAGSNVRDFQSDDLLQWHWRSFIDHESGISKYHFAVSNECLTTDYLRDLENMNGSLVFHSGETSNQHAQYFASEEGLFYLTVIAFNGAMEPSSAVCSDGLVVDKSPPVLQHLHLSTARTQPSIACSNNDTVWHVNEVGVARPIAMVHECSTHCSQYNDIDLLPLEIKRNNNGTLIIPTDSESAALCQHLPTYALDQFYFMPTDTIELTWDIKELESKVHSFYVGISSSRTNIHQPDIIAYQTTHKRMQYKCVHCGLGEGEEFVVQVKATSKAGLTNIASLGPVIIDLTPPVYDSGLRIALGTELSATWNATSFYDSEDPDLLSEYNWSLGTIEDPQIVENWRRVNTPHKDISLDYKFRIEYNIDQLHAFDQDSGNKYIFSVKAFNRAGFYTIATTAPYEMLSQALPSIGTIIHIEPYNLNTSTATEVGFQSYDDVLCAKWTGFHHHNNEVAFSIGVGTKQGLNDIIPSQDVNETSMYCFTGVSLTYLTTYYFNLHAYNTRGAVNATSRGIFITSHDEALKFAKVNDGLDCQGDFMLIDSNVTMEAVSVVIYHLEPLHSQMNYTLRIEQDWSNHLDNVVVKSVEVISNYSWRFEDSQLVQFFKLGLVELNQTISISSRSDTILNRVSLSTCLIDQAIQSSITALSSSWTFRPEVTESLTHFIVSFNEFQCSSISCTDGGRIIPETVVADDFITYHHLLHQGYSYKASVQVCFGPSCIGPVLSDGITVDQLPAASNSISCVITPEWRIQGVIYQIEVAWGLFFNTPGLRDSTCLIYDWAIATAPTGASLLTSWSRVKHDGQSEYIKISSAEILHIHERRTVFLVIRTFNDAHLTTLATQECVLENTPPPLKAPVYDLPVDYEDLDKLKDVLHSNQLGDLVKNIHEDEVDFSSSVNGISGALQGTDCSDYEWWVQESIDVNCRQIGTSTSCIKKRNTRDNIAQFRNMALLHSHHYFICVHGSGGSCGSDVFKVCSNGFVIDTQPPLPGIVYPGHNTEQRTHADNTSILIRWSGFSDLDEEGLVVYGSGIKEYFYAIGLSPMSYETSPFTSAGISQQALATGLNLQSGHLHYLSVKACDHVDLCTISTSLPIMVDSTPPTGGVVIVQFYNLNTSPLYDLIVRWMDFVDHESGIESYQLAIGTFANTQNIAAFQEVTGSVEFLNGANYRMTDGNEYFFQIKAVNRVGLLQIVSSRGILYDSTPPVTGFIHFGLPGEVNQRYSNDTKVIHFHWDGFVDPHSGIMYYRFCMGSYKGGCDVMAWKDVGLRTDVTKDFDLVSGKTYYVTVEACNSVLRCSSATSSPYVVDNTHPLPGVVKVGHSDEHNTYLSSKTSLAASWFGFHDPQSGIWFYQWCIGTSVYLCDIRPLQTAHLTTIQFATNLNLPEYTSLYVSVTATNNVGLQVQRSSANFIVDITPPVVIISPLLSQSLSLRPNTQYDRSIIKLEWGFTDDQSPILSHDISIHTHHDGDEPESFKVYDVKTMTRSLSIRDQLKDGNRYVASVTACNGAHLCTTSLSQETLVDSSPPHLGGFVAPMQWENNQDDSIVTLRWEGFDDAHSAISFYFIMISTTYNGNDISEGILKFPHNQTLTTQEVDIKIKKQIVPYTMVYLSIWAENGVGLISDAAKVGVFVLKTGPSVGMLDIERHSCDVHYCNYDCTCAAVNRQCQVDSIIHDCTELDALQTVIVYDIADNKGSAITASTACLRSEWELSNVSLPVTRFEWTIGAKSSQPGIPIFDIINEKHWFDVELYNRSTYCLTIPKTLEQSIEYVYYVKAWYSFEEYSIFSSHGVLVDTTPPVINLGRSVLDMDPNFVHELDFTTETSSIHASWKNVFRDAETGIDHYDLSFGTTQGGNEIYGPINMALATNMSLYDLNLEPGSRYYCTVHAFNPLGMVISASSDGFIIDTEAPFPGVVFSSLTFADNTHQWEAIEASWHGFDDLHSFIKSYEWGVRQNNGTEQDILFTNIGLQTSVSIPVMDHFPDGSHVSIEVIAYDAAGHSSPVTSSNPITLDRSPPEGRACESFWETPLNWKLNCTECESLQCSDGYQICSTQHSQKVQGHQFVRVTLTSPMPHFGLKARLQIGQMWAWIHFIREGPISYVHTSQVTINKDIKEIEPMVYIFDGQLEETEMKVELCTNPAVSQNPVKVQQVGQLGVALSWVVFDSHSEIGSVQVGLGTTPGGFQLMYLTDFSDRSSVLLPIGLRHQMEVFPVLLVSNKAGLTASFSTSALLIDWTPPVIENLVVSLKYFISEIEVLGSWDVTEAESTLQDCQWEIGLSYGADDLLTKSTTDSLYASTISFNTLVHGDSIFVTITCTNSLGVEQKKLSKGTFIILESPRADEGSLHVHPQSHSVFGPREQTQISTELLQFEFHGFDDITGIMDHEYRAGNGNTWSKISNTDHVLVDNMNLHGLTNISVRALNQGGIASKSVEDCLNVDANTPKLTGQSLSFTFNEDAKNMELNWSNVFYWKSNSLIKYLVYVGSEVGSANLITGLWTLEAELKVTSSLFRSPGECFVVITSVAPSGESVTYSKTILY